MASKQPPPSQNLRPGLRFTPNPAQDRGLAGTTWSIRPSEIKGPDGEFLLRLPAVETPVAWSQQAVNVVARQYLRKNRPGHAPETSIRDLIDRVVSAISDFAESKLGFFATAADAAAFRAHLETLLVEQKASFNSPVWFNCGLWHRYGITGSAGNWAIEEAALLARADGAEAKQLANSYERPQASACFIQSIEDDINSIFDLLKSEARLFKFGSGSGTNFSNLRSRFETLSGGGASSGLISFLEVFDRAAGATKSGGTTRRAAKMVCVDVDHPEILDFIRWKAKEEAKAQALIAQGFSGGMDGEAYRSVSGQNSNNSVRVTDQFMHKTKTEEAVELRARTDGAPIRSVKAKDVLRAIAESAWFCADPGLQFEDTIQAWHTCAATAPIRASNPCSEFMFLDNTACNLASLNLLRFMRFDQPGDAWGEFDVAEFRRAIRTLIVAQDSLVDLASYPTKQIAENSFRFRPLGLGYANLGAALMAKGYGYDSAAAREWAAAVTALMTAEAYAVSGELAEALGAFRGFARNRESMLGVLERHRQAAESAAASDTEAKKIFAAANSSFTGALKLAQSTGLRNSQVTVLAPTGTIAFMMDCDTTGIEPDFALLKTKVLAGGGTMTIVNRTVALALRGLGYSPTEIEAQIRAVESTGVLDAAKLRPGHARVFACAPDIAAAGHLEMMAAVQPFLSGAISKTVNLPETASVDDVEQVFHRAWKLGLKAVAVYREGSKSAQPLKSAKVAGASARAFSRELQLCPICSHPTVVTGTCWVCPQCGHSLACS